jgi:hypothetical protein
VWRGHLRWRAALLLSWISATLGCGQTASDRGTVTGTITIDGKPPANGSIAFTPVSGRAPTAGGTIVDGKYSVEAPLGESKVAIRVTKVVGQRKLYDHPESPVQPLVEDVLPPKYNDQTVLKIDVGPGTTTGDFDLKTK